MRRVLVPLDGSQFAESIIPDIERRYLVLGGYLVALIAGVNLLIVEAVAGIDGPNLIALTVMSLVLLASGAIGAVRELLS